MDTSVAAGNGWAARVQIWYAFRDTLFAVYSVVTSAVFLCVCTCTSRFCISGTARPIVFNFYSVNGDWGLLSYELSTSRVWDIAARAHLRARFRYLRSR